MLTDEYILRQPLPDSSRFGEKSFREEPALPAKSILDRELIPGARMSQRLEDSRKRREAELNS